MGNNLTHIVSNPMNRRNLLGKGAAMVGGAVAGFALQPGNAFGQEKPKTTEAPSHPAATKLVAPVNLHPPVVQVKGGKLRGLRDGKTYEFLGIPYAEADRFELPKPVQSWEGIKNAQVWGACCPSPAQAAVSGDELVFPHRYWIANDHCQFLNVWTQDLKPKAMKPVMVWIHGGGFTNGASMEAYAYDGKNLSEFGDVVAVSVNHRLNILGTLDLSAYGPEYANSRFTGMADLVVALQWVRDNIEGFGGDPGNVTILGQSGGGSKVVRLMHIPVAKGLFHKVVAQSGGGLSYRETNAATSIKTQQMIAAATLMNLGLDGSQISKLKMVPYTELIAAGTAALQSVGKELGRNVGWDPIADEQNVMTELCDWAADIPLIAGTVFSEWNGTLSKGDGRKNEWSQKEIDEQLIAEFKDKKDQVVAEFKKAYPRKRIQDVLYYAGSSRPGAKRVLAWKLEKSKKPVFNYVFTYEYPINGGITSFHCAEIAFVFHALGVPQVRMATGGAPEGIALQDKVSQAWVNFAKTGDPSQPGLEWKHYMEKDPQAMVFDAVSQCYALRDNELVAMLPPGGGPRVP
jgi:para-nitrobenzyl esterase